MFRAIARAAIVLLSSLSFSANLASILLNSSVFEASSVSIFFRTFLRDDKEGE